ncbi:nucleotidyltransferase family protein [Alkaliphilus transvaalensis]|uniref:hypothetical protein n=1 Tax=Alkaliphilus transvaalensis TaxID=114628 RepID=UPI00047C895F|nr:hypothetical protein [Alkaliphilus transvaalensis]
MILETLSFIGEKLNENEVLWAVGASLLLNQYGLIDKPNDIDLMVDQKDYPKVHQILKGLGSEVSIETKSSDYETECFSKYIIKGVSIDVMAGFIINHKEGQYKYEFDSSSVNERLLINDVEIPFTALEDWFVLYQLMKNREAKVRLIEDYLLTAGIKRKDLLERALTKVLPKEVKEKISNFL